ncbi:MAG TPA: hypothetical protein VJV74_04455, partial [Terriglobia bacterium]|nr:hypothetical protein [Terriglobia bacterium]
QDKYAQLRRDFRRATFISGARDVVTRRGVRESLAQTTAAADRAIAAACAIATGCADSGFAILALGRLGTREFDLLSDADLIFVRDPGLSEWQGSRLAEQVMEALSAYTREGTTFSVDTRLRPRGSQGELVVTPAQLEDYFRSEAQAWEALTYAKLRPIAGSQQLAIRHRLPPRCSELVLRLRYLCEHGAIGEADCAVLEDAALLLQSLEHAIRLATGRPRKELPSAEHARSASEKLAGWFAGRPFSPQELESAMARVREVFERLL